MVESTALVANRVAFKSISSLLEKQLPSIALVCPAGMSPKRLTRITLNALARNPYLLRCDPKSIIQAVTQSAELGLELGGVLGESYIVPFWDKKAGVQKATFIVGYRGMIKLALQSPSIVSMRAELVRTCDVFDYQLGTDPKIVHKPGVGNIEERGNVIAAYAIAFGREGPPQFSVMDDAELRKLYEDAKKKSGPHWWANPWNTNTGEMQRKSPIRRLSKTTDLSTALRKALEHEESVFEARPAAPPENERGEALKERLQPPIKPPDAVDAEFEPLDDFIQDPEDEK